MIRKTYPWLRELQYSLRHPAVRGGIYACVAVAALVVLVAILVWWPAQRETRQLMDAIENKRRADVEALFSAQLAQTAKQTEAQLEEIEKKLNTESVQVSLVNQFNLLARKHNVKILSESYEEGTEQKGYVPLYHELTFSGDYTALRRFLVDIGTLPTMSIVEEAALTLSSNARETIKVQLKLVTFRKAGNAATRRMQS